MLRLAKKPFRLHATFDPLQAGDLDVLRALELLENRAGLLDTLVRLAQPIGARRDAGRCAADMRLVETRAVGRYYFLTFNLPVESQDAEFGSSTLGLILTDDDPDLRLTPGSWSGLSCYIAPARPDDPPQRLRIRMYANVFKGDVFQTVLRRAGDRNWCLDQSFVDFNSDKAGDFLSYLAQGDTLVST